MMTFAHFWLANAWYPSDAVVVLRDVDGVQVNVGDTVAVFGTILSLSPTSTYLGDATVQLEYGPPASLTVSTLNTIKQ